MRISIVGLPGSGKSTAARFISDKISTPCIHIDRFWLEAGGRQGSHNTPNIEKVRAHVREKTLKAISRDSWVSDGFYPRVQPDIAKRADVILFLDIPLWQRLFNHAKRTFQSQTKHPELTFWDDVKFFIEIVRRDFTTKPKVRAFISEYQQKVTRLKSRKEINDYIAGLALNSARN